MVTQLFCEKPKPENGFAGFVQHIQSPLGIFRQPVDDVPGEIGAHAERCFSCSVTIAQDVFDSGDFGRLALLHLENKSRHGVSV
jgi:hypothetical protein